MTRASCLKAILFAAAAARCVPARRSRHFVRTQRLPFYVRQAADLPSESSPVDNSDGSVAEDTYVEEQQNPGEVEDGTVHIATTHARDKSVNAGDDGDGSDSDDDDMSDSDFEALDEDPSHHVHVEVELLEEENDDHGEEATPRNGGGGVGVRPLGQRLQYRRQTGHSIASLEDTDEQLLDAWQDFVFTALPALDTSKSRFTDGASKVRLDRRTLYAGLISEWAKRSSERPYLHPSTSKALQSALALATQPEWRQSLNRPSCVRLYDESPDRGCTLAMQETVAMALVSCMSMSYSFSNRSA